MVKKFEYTLEDCACEYCLYYEKATQWSCPRGLYQPQS